MQYQFLGIGYLTWITFLPVLGMIVVLLVPRANTNAMKWTALAATILQLVFAALIWINFNPAMTGINDVSKFQFVEKTTWINLQGVGWFGHVVIDYFLGIDGLSLSDGDPDVADFFCRRDRVVEHQQVPEGLFSRFTSFSTPA